MPKQSAKLRRLNAWARLISGGVVMLFAHFIASQLVYNSPTLAELQRDAFYVRALGAIMSLSGCVDFALISIAKRRS